MNNDTVIARTGELLIERYQLYVQRGGQTQEGAKKEEGGIGGVGTFSLMKIKNLNPSTWVSRELSQAFCVTRASRYELTKTI